MKKRISIKTCLLICFICVLCTVSVLGNSTIKQIIAYLNYDISIILDGEPKDLYDADGNKVYPIVYNGTTYLPLRGLGSLLNFNVSWDSATGNILLKTGQSSGLNLLDTVSKSTSISSILEDSQLSLNLNDVKYSFMNGVFCKALVNQDFKLKDYIGISLPKSITSISFTGYSKNNVSLNLFNQQGKLLKTFYCQPNTLNKFELDIDTQKTNELFFVAVLQSDLKTSDSVYIYDLLGY